MSNHQKGFIYIAIGATLFFFVAAQFVMQLGIAFLGLYLINNGLRLRGKPPLFYFLASWMDRF